MVIYYWFDFRQKEQTSKCPKNDKTHTTYRRCDRRAFHRQNKKCGACGYPRLTMLHCIL